MNANNSCSVFDVPDSKQLIDNFVTSCSPFTILLNSLVLYLAYNYVKLNHHLEQLHVISMTAADLIFGLVYMSTVKVNMDIPWFFCRSYYITVWTVSIASVMFLLLLNVHKMVILFFPIHSYMYMSKRKVLVQVICCWLGVFFCSIMFSLEPTLTHLDIECGSCLVGINPKLYLIMVICFYILPLLASLVISIMIFVFAQKKGSSRAGSKRPSNGGTQANEKKKMLKRVFFVFTSTIWTALTFLPYRVTYTKIQFCRIMYPTSHHRECLSENLEQAQNFFLFLLTFGTVINPLITIVTQKTYRKGVLDIWNKVFCCGKNDQLSSYSYTRRSVIKASEGDVADSVADSTY